VNNKSNVEHKKMCECKGIRGENNYKNKNMQTKRNRFVLIQDNAERK
jgi:hypothetical protein